MKILVIHGPNLNMLGKREPEHYGSISMKDINESLTQLACESKIEIETFQSNIEGEMLSKIHEALDVGKPYHGIILNAGAYTHTSIALRDAISCINVPVIEVHLSNIHAREEFRHKSLIAPVCKGQITGFGAESYVLALKYFMSRLH